MTLSRGKSRNSLSAQPLEIVQFCRTITIKKRQLRRLTLLLFRRERIPSAQKVKLILCSNAAIRKLNRQYRNMDRATDVLSFTYNDPDLLGEIYISLQKAGTQARDFGVPFDEEMARLVIHGFYHLLGYDHEKPSERRVMEEKERKALKAFVQSACRRNRS